MRIRTHLSIVKRALVSFVEVHPLQLSAALSYYMLLSLAPLVLVAITVASLVFGRETVGARLVAEVERLAGPAGGQVVASVINNPSPGTSGIVLAIGVVTILIGATSVFVQLEDSLNLIWRVKAKSKGNVVWSFVRTRLLSLAMVLGVGFLLLVSLLVSATTSAFCAWAYGTNDRTWIVHAADAFVSAVVVTGLFAMMLKVLPAVRIAWSDVWFGAAITALLFTAGKHVIALYLGHTGVGSAYGAAGSIVVLMVWVYYASLILLFGAQLTQTRVGIRARPHVGVSRDRTNP